MKVAQLGAEFPPGPAKESTRLFEGQGYVVATLTLRAGGVVPTHVAKDPIVITCVAGRGELFAEGTEVPLGPGTVVALPAGVPHALRAADGLRIVLVRATGRPDGGGRLN